MNTHDAAGAGAAGVTAADPEALRTLGTGLHELSETLGSALAAVDSLPLELVTPVLGAVGADFVAALDEATTRHREVLGSVARVAGSAGDLVLATGRLYSETDAHTATTLREG